MGETANKISLVDQVRREAVGVIGLGVMGEPMARNLLAAGLDVVVQSRSSGPAERLGAFGAVLASNAREVAQASAVVVVVVGDLSDLRAVFEGPDGLVAGAHPGLVVVDCGSHDPAAMPSLATMLRSRDADFLDAPLSGGEAGAREGSLAVMVGGSSAALAVARPILDVIASTVVHMGDVGTGQVAKACNQLVVASNIQALAEALALARAAGVIDPSFLLAAMAGGLANSRVLELNGPRMLRRDYKPGGKARFHLRDLRNTASAAASCGMELPMLDLVVSLFERLVDAGLGRSGP